MALENVGFFQSLMCEMYYYSKFDPETIEGPQLLNTWSLQVPWNFWSILAPELTGKDF